MPLFTGILRDLTEHLHERGAMSDEEYRKKMRGYRVEEGVMSAVVLLMFVAVLTVIFR